MAGPLAGTEGDCALSPEHTVPERDGIGFPVDES